MNPESNPTNSLRLFLCGDVMTGRGIDQVLPHPSDPALFESHVHDARDYVALAETAHGSIPRPVALTYIWGDAWREMAMADLRIINLETSITSSDDHWSGKPIHYRMHPQNVTCLTIAKINGCTLANNHTLDWGYAGLVETLRVLDNAKVGHAGAGRNQSEAETPAILNVTGKGRTLLFSLGSPSSGVPLEWSATETRSGVNIVSDLSEKTAEQIVDQLQEFKQPDDTAIASIHWASNWNYEIPLQQIRFAHQLIDGGFDVIHGHSSHHVKAIEVYRGHLILYGCGDFITDYEGITGYEDFRGDLALMYLPRISPETGRLLSLRLIPLQMRQFQLRYASVHDFDWLCTLVNRLSKPFGTKFKRVDRHALGWMENEQNTTSFPSEI